jgi:hypothetical protein
MSKTGDYNTPQEALERLVLSFQTFAAKVAREGHPNGDLKLELTIQGQPEGVAFSSVMPKVRLNISHYHYGNFSGGWVESKGLDFDETARELLRLLARDSEQLRLAAPKAED